MALIEVRFTIPDTRAMVLKKKLESLELQGNIDTLYLHDGYRLLCCDFSDEQLEKIGRALINPVIQEYHYEHFFRDEDFDFIFEVSFLPGVTDNIGTTVKEIVHDMCRLPTETQFEARSSQIIYINGKLSKEDVQKIEEYLANPLIQRVHRTDSAHRYCRCDEAYFYTVGLNKHFEIMEVDLEVSDDELKELGKKGILERKAEQIPEEFALSTKKLSELSQKGVLQRGVLMRRGPLALSLQDLHIIRDYFRKEGRKPYDIELEAIAQTWSEHCKHTIFASPIDDIQDGLYRHYIKRATQEIRQSRGENDICLSVFKDNSGAIIFDDNYAITDKVETHNSPSALDPFGGALTGILGVNRDCIGFGLGAKPIINRYGFCVGLPDDIDPIFKDKKLHHKMLLPERIMEGVIEGVASGGNCSGIPSPCGFIHFDSRYKGKPLVFAGTIGLIPRSINSKPSFEKKAQTGDYIVMIGGKVGQDGIHGATFSSEALEEQSPTGAVQIGDPITQKKFSDALIKEARDLDLYNSITDNGAGGLSCSVSEMARECGGFRVDLERVPLKYPNLEPWKIWISESQERMTLAVPPLKWEQFSDLMKRRGVSAWIIGEFTDLGRCEVSFQGKKIMDMEMEFLHEGLRYAHLKTQEFKPMHKEPDFDCPENLEVVLKEMIARPNIRSYDYISTQYDHVVLGGAVLLPLQGKGKVNASVFVTRPVLSSLRGVVLSFGLYPWYSDIDCYAMAACSIDTAIRNCICAGGSLDHLALLDNFCWCSSDDPKRLYQLKEACRACYEYAVYYGTAFISGKDSMFNDFRGFDSRGQQIKISVPPTLLISSIGVIQDARKCVSMDFKFPGDLIYVIGETKNELGASEYFEYIGEKLKSKPFIGNAVPKVDPKLAKKIYIVLEKAIDHELVASAQSVTRGGLGVALGKKALAGKLGCEVDLSCLKLDSNLDRDDYLLFSESQSRVVVTVAPENQKRFEKIMKGLSCRCIGVVENSKKVVIKGLKVDLMEVDLYDLKKMYSH